MSGTHVRFRFDVWVDDDTCYNTVVDLHGVRKMTQDDQVVDSLGMEGDYANVIQLSRSANTVGLVVAWRSFVPRKNEICSYKLDFDRLDMQAEKLA